MKIDRDIVLMSFAIFVVCASLFVSCYIIAKKINESHKPVVIEQESPIPYDYVGDYEITYYCSGTVTSSGNKVNHLITAASDSTHFAFNDIVYIEGFNNPVVIHDRGGAVKGNVIDVYINDCDQAIKNGRQVRKVYKLSR